MLIPQIQEKIRRESYVAATGEAYELIARAIRLLEKYTTPQSTDYPHDFWIAEREHRHWLQALRDVRDQCKMLHEAKLH